MGIHIIFLDLEFSFESSGLKLLLGTKHRNIYNISSVIKDMGGGKCLNNWHKSHCKTIILEGSYRNIIIVYLVLYQVLCWPHDE
jgi:hypothetical protein